MSFDTYDVYFAGRIIEGKDPAEGNYSAKLAKKVLDRFFVTFFIFPDIRLVATKWHVTPL